MLRGHEAGSPRVPGWWLLALAAVTGVLLRATGPVKDVDLFWHLRVGQLTLDGKTFPHPDPFAYTLPSVHWKSTQWLAEALLAGVYDVAGLAGIVALRLVLVVVLLVGLVLLLLRARERWSGPVVFAVTAVPLVAFIQDRPQLLSLLFVVWLSWQVDRLLRQGTPPRRWVFVGVTYLWANVHGLFFLAPGVLVLLALPGLRTDGRRAARGLLTTAVLALAASALTPRGPGLLLAPLSFGAAGKGFIVEWAPTDIRFSGSWGFFGLLALLLLAALRGLPRRRADETGYVLVLVVFGLLAVRNTAPASLLLAPVALAWCDEAWPTRSSIGLPRRLFVLLAAVLPVVALLGQVGQPLLRDKPARIAGYLAQQPAGTRVLDEYNVSGYLLLHAPQIRVAIDGRADRYGGHFIGEYVKAVSGDPSWRRWVTGLHPDLAVLSTSSPLPELMRAVLGWRTVMTDHDYVLLAPPSAVATAQP